MWIQTLRRKREKERDKLKNKRLLRNKRRVIKQLEESYKMSLISVTGCSKVQYK